MSRLRIASWNINSVRLRIDHVARFVAEAGPDVVCLQEIKCRDGEFPSAAFAAMGLPHLHVVGQKGSHGVAVASRLPLEPLAPEAFCRHAEARLATVRVAGIELHNLYVPAGGDEPDRDLNPKFDHKLDFLARMRACYAQRRGPPLVLVGDLNVAPGEHDVWSHKQLLNVVSHTPAETEALDAIRVAGRFVDLARAAHPEPQKLYTWWSYRSPDWAAGNRGRRLDHIWADADVAERAAAYRIHLACRGWERPSDHVPVSIEIAAA